MMKGFNYKKAVQALNFVALQAGGSINKMKALKLIWLSDRLHLRRYSRTITGDVYFALKNGPVASTTRNLLEDWNRDYPQAWSLEILERDYRNQFIAPCADRYTFQSISALSEKIFSKTDLEILNLIYAQYGHLDHFQLSELSHEFPEWKPYEALFKVGEVTRIEINLIDFFKNYPDEGKLFNDEAEYLSISKEMYLFPMF